MAPSLVTWPTSRTGIPDFFSHHHQAHRGFPHLADAARGGCQFAVEHGLDGIHHHHAGPMGFHHLNDGVHVDFRDHQHIGRHRIQALTAESDLSNRFLAGDIEHLAVVVGQAAQGLQHEGGFADAGITADQHQAAFHQPAAQNPVELPHERLAALFGFQIHLVDGDRFRGGRKGPARCTRNRRRSGGFHHGVPLFAFRAAAHPAQGLIPAGLTGKKWFSVFWRWP